MAHNLCLMENSFLIEHIQIQQTQLKQEKLQNTSYCMKSISIIEKSFESFMNVLFEENAVED
jgi:hypothetical protein